MIQLNFFRFQEDKHAYTRCPLVPKSPVLLSAENDAADSVSSVSPQKSPVLACQLGRLDKPAHPLRIIEPALSSPPAFPAPPVPSDESSICDFDDLDRSSMPPPIPPRGIKSMRPVPHPLLLSQIPPPPPPRLSPESRREGGLVRILTGKSYHFCVIREVVGKTKTSVGELSFLRRHICCKPF